VVELVAGKILNDKSLETREWLEMAKKNRRLRHPGGGIGQDENEISNVLQICSEVWTIIENLISFVFKVGNVQEILRRVEVFWVCC